MNNIAIYPGSFDPITKGHEDIINRALDIFDKVYVVILDNPDKNNLFSLEERKELIRKVTKDYDNVEVDGLHDLAINYAKSKGARFIVRGLRVTDDFEYESKIFAFNQIIDKEIDTIFLMTRLENSFISSSGVKEMASYNVDISKLVSKEVEEAILKKMKKDDADCI